jgi:hypothetical protein
MVLPLRQPRLPLRRLLLNKLVVEALLRNPPKLKKEIVEEVECFQMYLTLRELKLKYPTIAASK